MQTLTVNPSSLHFIVVPVVLLICSLILSVFSGITNARHQISRAGASTQKRWMPNPIQLIVVTALLLSSSIATLVLTIEVRYRDLHTSARGEPSVVCALFMVLSFSVVIDYYWSIVKRLDTCWPFVAVVIPIIAGLLGVVPIIHPPSLQPIIVIFNFYITSVLVCYVSQLCTAFPAPFDSTTGRDKWIGARLWGTFRELRDPKTIDDRRHTNLLNIASLIRSIIVLISSYIMLAYWAFTERWLLPYFTCISVILKLVEPILWTMIHLKNAPSVDESPDEYSDEVLVSLKARQLATFLKSPTRERWSRIKASLESSSEMNSVTEKILIEVLRAMESRFKHPFGQCVKSCGCSTFDRKNKSRLVCKCGHQHEWFSCIEDNGEKEYTLEYAIEMVDTLLALE